MADSFVICPGCDKRLRPLRRYPLEPLGEHFGWSVSAACRHLGISGSTQKDARCHGITRRTIDTLCAKLRTHPAEVWPEIVDHDIEDASRPCDYCHELFIPARSSRFCSKKCRRRADQGKDNNRRRARYANNAEYRERRKADSRAYSRAYSRYKALQRKAWKENNPERAREVDSDYRARNRDEINARQRARYAQRRSSAA